MESTESVLFLNWVTENYYQAGKNDWRSGAFWENRHTSDDLYRIFCSDPANRKPAAPEAAIPSSPPPANHFFSKDDFENAIMMAGFLAPKHEQEEAERLSLIYLAAVCRSVRSKKEDHTHASVDWYHGYLAGKASPSDFKLDMLDVADTDRATALHWFTKGLNCDQPEGGEQKGPKELFEEVFGWLFDEHGDYAASRNIYPRIREVRKTLQTFKMGLIMCCRVLSRKELTAGERLWLDRADALLERHSTVLRSADGEDLETSVLREAVAYLDETVFVDHQPVQLNNIGAGSILHRKMAEALNNPPIESNEKK